MLLKIDPRAAAKALHSGSLLTRDGQVVRIQVTNELFGMFSPLSNLLFRVLGKVRLVEGETLGASTCLKIATM